jgi:hypothetical protein
MVVDGNALIKFEPALSLLTTFFVHPSPIARTGDVTSY